MILFALFIGLLGGLALVWSSAGPGTDMNPITGAYEPGYARKRWSR